MVRLLMPFAMMTVFLVATTTSQTLSSSLVTCTLTNGSSISFDPNAEYHYENNCYKIKCEGGKFVNYQSGCLADDACYPEGQMYYADGCRRFVCAEGSPDTYVNLFMEQHCVGMYGGCHGLGEPFRLEIQGVIHDCTCNTTLPILDTYDCSEATI